MSLGISWARHRHPVALSACPHPGKTCSLIAGSAGSGAIHICPISARICPISACKQSVDTTAALGEVYEHRGLADAVLGYRSPFARFGMSGDVLLLSVWVGAVLC